MCIQCNKIRFASQVSVAMEDVKKKVLPAAVMVLSYVASVNAMSLMLGKCPYVQW